MLSYYLILARAASAYEIVGDAADIAVTRCSDASYLLLIAITITAYYYYYYYIIIIIIIIVMLYYIILYYSIV